MYLLKKITGFGGGGKSAVEDETDKDESSSVNETASVTQNGSEITEDTQDRKSKEKKKKKRHKNAVEKKMKKEQKPEEEKSQEEDASSSCDSKQIVADNLSETEENSTSQDVSNVELNDNNVQKRGSADTTDADFWTDVNEKTENSEFWGDQKEEEVNDKGSTNNEDSVDFWGSVNDDASTGKKSENEVRIEDIDDFWGDRDEDDLPNRHKRGSDSCQIKGEIAEQNEIDGVKGEAIDILDEQPEDGQGIRKVEQDEFWGDQSDDEQPNESKEPDDSACKAHDERKISSETSCKESEEFEAFSETDSSAAETRKDFKGGEMPEKYQTNETERSPVKDEVPDVKEASPESVGSSTRESPEKSQDSSKESSQEVTSKETTPESSKVCESSSKKDTSEETEDESSSEEESPEETKEPIPKDTQSQPDAVPTPERTISESDAKPEVSERKHSIGEDVAKTPNEVENRTVHRRSFINVLKEIEQPPRRKSVILPDARERNWKETKESLSESVEDDTDTEEGPDHCIMDYLGKENDKAEARLAARRQARVEAREIRLRELERQQKEQEENADKVFDMSYSSEPVLRPGRVSAPAIINPRDRNLSTANSYHSSRRSSEDSIEEGLSLRDIRHELKEMDDKFRKAMIANAQLDNEKSALAYQVELLKDKLEDLEESQAQLTREHRDKCREHEQLKRAALKLKEDVECCKSLLDDRDRLIAEYGLVIVGGDGDDEESSKRTLVSVQSAELLQQAGSGSLDVRLKKFAEERNELLDEIRHLKLELEEERSKRRSDSKSGSSSLTNGPLDEEINNVLSDYKFKLQKAEQDVSTLQANVARLESQVIRYKSAAETSEKAEDELKVEKRKLQRENRESIARIEELETANSHLQRRMDKLKNAKSTLLKEL